MKGDHHLQEAYRQPDGSSIMSDIGEDEDDEQMLFEQIAKQAGLHQTHIAVDTAPAEAALQLGHPPEVPAAEEEGETTDDEGIEGRAEENKQHSMLPSRAMESPAGIQQHSVLPQPMKSPLRANPDAQSGCDETPSSPILIPTRLDLRAASKQAAEEKPKSIAKKRGLEERPDDSHQTACSKEAQIHQEAPATE